MHKLCLFCGGKKRLNSDRLEINLPGKMKAEPRNGQPEYAVHVKFLTIFDRFTAILPKTGEIVQRNLLKIRAIFLLR